MNREDFASWNRSEFEGHCRARARAVPIGDGTALCRVLGHPLLYVPIDDLGISPWLMVDGFWEPWVTLAMGRLIKPDWHCVDVGANCGYYTALMATLGAKVFSVEPNQALVDVLALSARANGWGTDKVMQHDFGLGAHAAEGSLRVPDRQTCLASLTAFGTTACKIAVTTLDALDLGRVDLIKIDAEGYDYNVLRGAKGTLARNPECVVFLEHCPRFHVDPEAELAYLYSLGRVGFVDYDGSIHAIAREGVKGRDYWELVLTR